MANPQGCRTLEPEHFHLYLRNFTQRGLVVTKKKKEKSSLI